jgi:hypothetical protein
MATGWWASLWRGRPAPQEHSSREPDRVPDDGARAVRPHRPDALPTDDEAAPHHAPAGATHARVALRSTQGPVHTHTSGPPGRPGSLPDPVRSDPPRTPPRTTGAPSVAQLDNVIADLLAIEGASGAAIVDIDSGMALAAGGTPGFDLNVAAAGNSNVVRAKLRTISDLELKDEIEDVLITLQGQYHLINVLRGQGNSGLFIYLVLNRVTANLALARHKLRAIAATVSV